MTNGILHVSPRIYIPVKQEVIVEHMTYVPNQTGHLKKEKMTGIIPQFNFNLEIFQE